MENEWYYCPVCGKVETKYCITKQPQYGVCPICNIRLMPSGYDVETILTEEEIEPYFTTKYGDKCYTNEQKTLARELLFKKVIKPNPQFNPEKHEEYLRYSNAVVAELKAKQAEEERLQEREERNKVKCPRCGSTQIQMVQRKWSFWTGFLTNKVDRVCVKCKHRW